MINVLKFLSSMHEELKTDFEYGQRNKYDGERITRDPLRYNCTNLAKEVTRLFISDGKRPKIIRIGRQDSEGHFLDRLFPKIYEGHEGWRYHDVCILDSRVYDPMVGVPLELDDYFEKYFGQKFEIHEHRFLKEKIQNGSL